MAERRALSELSLHRPSPCNIGLALAGAQDQPAGCSFSLLSTHQLSDFNSSRRLHGASTNNPFLTPQTIHRQLNTSSKMSMPPSSPRLPSPPPPTEIQIGPKSPSVGSFSSQEPTIEQSIIDANAIRRIHPGTKAADMAAGPPLVPLGEVCVGPPNNYAPANGCKA